MAVDLATIGNFLPPSAAKDPFSLRFHVLQDKARLRFRGERMALTDRLLLTTPFFAGGSGRDSMHVNVETKSKLGRLMPKGVME